jgi:conjugal transfer pilus assembly protein TraD
MSPPPRPRRAPYWTLPALALMLALPYSWVLGAMAGAIALSIAGPAIRRAVWRRTAARQADPDGVLLGIDERGRSVVLADRQLAAHGLIVGASGAGKSTTMLAILGDAIRRGQPVMAIDLKGSPSFARELGRVARNAGRPFSVWSPDGPAHFNPLARGNATALKDKLIGTERFSEPHYQRAAERYLQTVFQVLHAAQPGRSPELDEVVSLMDPRRLRGVTRHLGGPLADRVQDYVSGLTPDQVSGIRGLGTRLAILSESHAGQYLSPAPSGGHTIDLGRVLAGDEVVVFSLNSSLYGKLAAQLGTLVLQDLITNVGHRLEHSGDSAPQALVGIDEFSAMGSDHLLALLARGREAGVSGLLATQELADLDRAAPGFRDQVLGLTSVKLVHRQDVPSSARMIADMIGTERVWEETRTVQGPFGRRTAMRGTRRLVDRHVVDPNEIKTLPTGRLVMITKTPVAAVTRVQVRPLQHVEARSGRAPAVAVPPLLRGPATEALPALERPQPSPTAPSSTPAPRTPPSRTQPRIQQPRIPEPGALPPARQPPRRVPPDAGR